MHIHSYWIFFLHIQHISNESYLVCKYFHETKSLDLEGSEAMCMHMSLTHTLNYPLETLFQFVSTSG